MTFSRLHSVTLTAIHRQVPSLPLFSSVLQAVQAWGWHLAGREEKPALKSHGLVQSPGTRIRCLSGETEENKRHSTQSEWPV